MSEHEWSDPDVDWKATRTCRRCGVIQEYDHGPNSGPTLYYNFGKWSEGDPGCSPVVNSSIDIFDPESSLGRL